MRGLLHLCAIVLLLPQVLMALALAMLGFVFAERTVSAIFLHALTAIDLALGWVGLLLLIATLLLIAAGFSPRFRSAASVAVIAIAIVSAASLFRQLGFELILEAWWFFVPAIISILLAAWNRDTRTAQPRSVPVAS